MKTLLLALVGFWGTSAFASANTWVCNFFPPGHGDDRAFFAEFQSNASDNDEMTKKWVAYVLASQLPNVDAQEVKWGDARCWHGDGISLQGEMRTRGLGNERKIVLAWSPVATTPESDLANSPVDSENGRPNTLVGAIVGGITGPDQRSKTVLQAEHAPASCLSAKREAHHMSITNSCSRRIRVAFCYKENSNELLCERAQHGIISVSPSRPTGVSLPSTNGPGKITMVGCFEPAIPSDVKFDGSTLRIKCR